MPSPTALPRARFGIAGLDDVLDGGVPRETLMLLTGSPGSGKTTLALHFLSEGARQGERCLFICNSETPAQLATIAASHGWDLEAIELLDWRERPTSGAESSDYTLFPEAEVEVEETLEHVFARIDALRPQRLVIDSLSALRVVAPNAAFYRRQIQRIHDFSIARGCTLVLVDDVVIGDLDLRAQTLAHGLIELEHLDFQFGADRRRLRVRKLRGSTFRGGFHDFVIETGGIQVFPRLVATHHDERPTLEPAESGLAALDALAGGGLPRGSSTLLIGPAGSGKSTLSAIYVRAAAQRGERSAVYLFDEAPSTYLARCRGLGIPLEPHLASGAIRLDHLDPAELTPGQIAHRIVSQVESDDVRLVVIDTLNGYLHSAAEEPMVLLQLREVLSYLARRGVVAMMTLTQHGILGSEMVSPIDISFLSDNVFLLRYFETQGAIHQALSMVKRRTGPHERTIRELRMTIGGVDVGPPLEDFSGVLLGTPRYDGPSLAQEPRS